MEMSTEINTHQRSPCRTGLCEVESVECSGFEFNSTAERQKKKKKKDVYVRHHLEELFLTVCKELWEINQIHVISCQL